MFFFIFFCSQNIFASMYFEPVAGYGKGTSDLNTAKANTYISPSVGFKFGYFVRYVYLVGDIRYSVLNITEESSDSSPGVTSYGIGVGWDWNIPIRTFIGFDLKASTSINGNSFSGSGQRIGIGYYLSLNTLLSIEFVSQKMTFETSSSTEIDFNNSQTLLTFSFPVEFMYPQTSWKDKVRK
ncbi:MAG: hypothetical protein KDD40_02075 [Bdellovibrionales bacterium]|nr:hypothetical protein [Bdellovibrionales bacterium]